MKADLAAARAERDEACEGESLRAQERDAARAEVERAFRAGVMLIMVCPFTSADVDAEWSRYQQENKA